ncbi:NUDIX hydrolase [Kibdelosporangium philippinense]|uniref:NUDIX hydrolase n=1 Tax=Kibdelosporangium philippinense TaxID=211113 RepID=A0ABS8ZQ90_9PSEU|nr:NUDIX hydrolase [Kibdelosporangium philippinense]MCE7009358.1 NUDIX hydrolase [Kibdelosporangium philippinense]
MVLPESMVPDVFPDPPVTPKDAATVVLLRDTSAGIEAFLLRRVVGMAFAGGMSVFPGGGVDRRDAAVDIAWAGPPASWWAAQFACPEPLARSLVCAAVRETFEESGVLLAGPSADSVVSDTGPYAGARKSLVEREFSFAEFLADTGLVLRADLLRPWANWVTPAEEPRRYDTKFFIAALPEGQRADGSTSEADHAEWRRPADAIDLWKAGQRGLLPPTWMTLTELGEKPTVADAMATDRTISKIIPKVIREGRILRPVLPGDPAYDRAFGHLDARPDDTLG